MKGNILMVSADRSVVADERGPFWYMLESFHRHWDRVDVIGTRPARRVHDTVFGNVHLHHPRGGKLRQVGFIRDTGRALAAERPYTVITSHDYNPFYNGLGSWAISRAAGIPYVAEIHHVPGHPRPANLRERIDRPLTRLYCRWARSRAAGFRVVNAVELPPLLEGWGVPAERIHVLPSLYLDREVFRPDRQVAPAGDELLFVGRLVANKGLDAILGALAHLGRGGLRPRLRVIGRGPLAGWLHASAARQGLADQLEHVEWVEDAEALAQAYRRATLVVCASASEGGPRVVAEALACGTPVVSTPVGIVPEVVREGVTGHLFDGTAEGLAAELGPLLRDPSRLAALREGLPPDMARFDREAVIENLATGLKAIAAEATGC